MVPDEEIHRARSERFPGAGALTPGIGVCHRLPQVCVFTSLEARLTPHVGEL